MDRATRFWDNIAERYNRTPVGDEAAYRRKLEITRRYFGPDMRVLEFGCGTGSTAIAHAPFVEHILATDPSPKMLEFAVAKAASEKTRNVTFRKSSIEAFDAPGESFDAVLCLSLLHLLQDRDAAIARVSRLLKPGGVFVSSTVCSGGMLNIFKLIGPIGHFFGVLPLIRVFTTNELRESLAGAGFSIEHEWQPGKGKAVFIVARKATPRQA